MTGQRVSRRKASNTEEIECLRENGPELLIVWLRRMRVRF
jgi:hypothetical protein